MKTEERFWAKIDAWTTDGCWNWTACLTNGYGHLWVAGRTVRAHRFAYELLVGPIPEGLVIDHLCRNHACVRPDHLEPVTQAVNVQRGIGPAATRAPKAECPQGHLYAGSNVYLYRGKRNCRECRNARKRAWRRARRGGGGMMLT